MLVVVTAAPGASRRTKTRIREHGPVFVTGEAWVDNPDETFLMTPTKSWFGWLPNHEVLVTPVEV